MSILRSNKLDAINEAEYKVDKENCCDEDLLT